MDINEIQTILPHRYPFLLVDRIEELEPGEWVQGYKNVTVNEEFFQGHFPDEPIMPGVLILEAMAQVSGFLMLHTLEDTDNKIPLLVSVDRARFRRPVVPGDRLNIEAEVIKLRKSLAKIEAGSYVKEKLVAEAVLMFAVKEREERS